MRSAWVCLLVLLAGCDPLPVDPPHPKPDSGPPPDCDAPTIFTRSCVAGCHDPTQRQGGLDLETSPPGPRLIGKRATGRADYLIIDPEIPEESALLLKLSLMPPFGARMPLGGAALGTTERACVQTWLQRQLFDGGAADASSSPDSGRDGGAGDAGAIDGGRADAGRPDAGTFWGPVSDDAGCAPAGDAGGWCVALRVPEPLYAVRGRAPNDVWAVGSRGATYHYDGNSWGRLDSGVGATLFDVFPISANDVWAVGEQGLVLRYQSGSWNPVAWVPSSTVVDAGLLPSGQPTWDLGGVFANGNDLWATGAGGTLAHRIGNSMQVHQTSHPNQPDPDLLRIYSRGPDEWWAVGDMAIREWDGGAPNWISGRGAILRMFGLAGSVNPTTSERILVGVGADGRLYQYDYTDPGTYPWQPPSYDPDRLELQRDLRAVWLNGMGVGWTVGLDGEVVFIDVARKKYARVVSPTFDHLLGVWGTDVRTAWAVGGRSTGVILKSR